MRKLKIKEGVISKLNPVELGSKSKMSNRDADAYTIRKTREYRHRRRRRTYAWFVDYTSI